MTVTISERGQMVLPARIRKKYGIDVRSKVEVLDMGGEIIIIPLPKGGFKAARGRYVVTMDADLQNDPHDIPMLLSHLEQWDAVTGWRVNRAAGDSLIRRLSSQIANRVRNVLSDETIRDSGCTFRGFRRECLKDLVLYKGFHRFIPTLLRMRGFRVLEVPVNHRLRRFGQSKYGIGNRAFRAFYDLLVVRWMKDRLLRYEVAENLGGDGGPSQ